MHGCFISILHTHILTYVLIIYIVVVDSHAFFLGEELAADGPAHENEGSTWIVPGRKESWDDMGIIWE